MVNVAIYDAVNGVDVARNVSDREAALVDPAGAPAFASKRAAASAAAHAVLSALHPSLADAYDDQLTADLGVSSRPFVARAEDPSRQEMIAVARVAARFGDLPAQRIRRSARVLTMAHAAGFRWALARAVQFR